MYYSAARIFDGTNWQQSMAVETEEGRIKRICPARELSADTLISDFSNCSIVPAFIDAQVYGAGGRLFSAYPDTESLRLLAEHSWEGGAAVVQPTVATNSPEVVRACIDAVREYWKQGGEGIGGLHLEGPWISAARKGAHIEAFIHAPSIEEVRELLTYGKGIIRTITLAPEECGIEVIELLQQEGIVLSAGHSNCIMEEAVQAFEKGVHTVTHLYNAMSPLHHRAPGLVGACFAHSEVHASIIPDGHHVNFAAVRIAHNNMRQRLFAITDAVTESSIGPYQHEWNTEGYYTSGGILSGSALTMDQAFRNLLRSVEIQETSALEMCGPTPARIFGWGHYGHIVPGAAACFLVYDQDWKLVARISEPGSRSPALCGAVHTG
ncbi:MAG: N-acetylglucosamine-6-phosphate deacetylase [Chitinophagaceae bacterium]|nr:MAG: N-acetylglucosamine-6-phosphate deacetylase [Chitinophagaceae bacterium]